MTKQLRIAYFLLGIGLTVAIAMFTVNYSDIKSLQRSNAARISKDNQEIKDIQSARKQGKKLVYCTIDKLIIPLKLILAPSSPQDLHKTIKKINETINAEKLPQKSKVLLLDVLDTLAAAEIQNPVLTHLGHQFNVSELPCPAKI